MVKFTARQLAALNDVTGALEGSFSHVCSESASAIGATDGGLRDNRVPGELSSIPIKVFHGFISPDKIASTGLIV